MILFMMTSSLQFGWTTTVGQLNGHIYPSISRCNLTLAQMETRHWITGNRTDSRWDADHGVSFAVTIATQRYEGIVAGPPKARNNGKLSGRYPNRLVLRKQQPWICCFLVSHGATRSTRRSRLIGLATLYIFLSSKKSLLRSGSKLHLGLPNHFR